MTNYMESYLQYELDSMKLNNIYESEYDKFNIAMMELKLNTKNNEYLLESSNIILEEATNGLVDKVLKFISSIIEVISNFIGDMVLSISNVFHKKETKNKLDELNMAIDADPNNPKLKKTVEIYQAVKVRDTLDEYIKEMAKLERKAMNLKIDYKLNASVKDGTYIVEYNAILREMDQLDAKYDKAMLNDNNDIIKMAMKDAIRFSDKELNNVKIDYDQVKKGSNEILAQFKKDAKGCDVPIKLNLIQKMSNAISTKVRKVVRKMTTYKHRNLKTVLAIAAAIGTVTYVLKNPKAREKVTGTFNKGIKGMQDFSKKMDEESAAIRAKL